MLGLLRIWGSIRVQRLGFWVQHSGSRTWVFRLYKADVLGFRRLSPGFRFEGLAFSISRSD